MQRLPSKGLIERESLSMFRLEAACAKCGFSSSTYLTPSVVFFSIYFYRALDEKEYYIEDVIERICHRCGHTWFERPLDDNA